jgi:hypothetical protein
MNTDMTSDKQEKTKTKVVYNRSASEAVYGLGLLGAWYYYISTATSFGMGLLGLLKGIIWPAMLVYEALKFLGM